MVFPNDVADRIALVRGSGTVHPGARQVADAVRNGGNYFPSQNRQWFHPILSASQDPNDGNFSTGNRGGFGGETLF